MTEVFQPVLSKDGNGNLVVATDENGDVQKAWSTYAFYPTETADVISHRTEDVESIKAIYFPDNADAGAGGSRAGAAAGIGPRVFSSNTYCMTNEELNQFGQSIDYDEIINCTDKYVYGMRDVDGIDYVLSENHFCLSAECDKHIQTINSHLGLTELTTWKALNTEEQMQAFYVPEQTQITDAYVIRVYYTADEIPMNWVRRCELRDHSAVYRTIFDVYGTECGEADSTYFFDKISITTEDRDFRYTDIWILPEGVETVLTLEDMTTDDTPSNDNSSNDSSNENNKPNDDNTTTTKPYEFDLSNAESQTVSKEDFTALLEANKESDVVIKSNNGVTFTFARGTMTEVDGKESYDFSTSINNTYTDTMPSYIQKNSFVSQINFNYSGTLPAMASIRFYVGTDYAGKTLYYSLMNEDNTFAEVKSYVVDAEGYMTVWQDHCSSYVVTTEEPKQQETTPPVNNDNDTKNNTNTTTDNTTNNAVTSPKTNDMIKMLLPVAGMLLLAVGGVFVGMKKRKMM